MATRYWLGTATAQAQVQSAQVTAYDVATTYSISVNNVVICSAIAEGSAAATATELVDDWNAATHPYAVGVTASLNVDIVVLTADTAGVPFVPVSGVSGGAGTMAAFSITTANLGPADWSAPYNWSGATVPVDADDVYIENTSKSILYGLDQSSVYLNSLNVAKSFTGKIGLNPKVFATSADGATTVSTVTEAKPVRLNIDATTVKIGEATGASTAAGSSRINLDLGTSCTDVVVYDTATSPSETGRNCVELLPGAATTEVHVLSAPGGVGLATLVPGETATVSKVHVADTNSSTKVNVGEGTTITTWDQYGGTNTLEAAATITTVTVRGGTLDTRGDYTITTGNAYGGTWNADQIKTAGNAFTTLNVDGGTVDATGYGEARTWATVNLKKGTLKADGSVVTITTLADSTTAIYTAQVT